MIGSLPEELEVGGQVIPINADFRNILTIFAAYNDTNLTEQEKVYITLARLYGGKMPYYYIQEAYEKAVWFMNGGNTISMSKPEEVQILDWEHDEGIIMPAVSKTIGVPDVRGIPFLHWWSFLGAFGEIGEGLFSTIIDLRQKKAKGKKLSKTELEFWHKNKDLCKLVTAEEQAAIDETEAFLKTII